MTNDVSREAVQNTDKEIWRRVPDDYYADRAFVTVSGAIGICSGGLCVMRPVDEWIKLAMKDSATQPEVTGLAEACKKRAYTMSEPHLSGARVVVGFESLVDANAFMTAVVNNDSLAASDAQALSEDDLIEKMCNAFEERLNQKGMVTLGCQMKAALKALRAAGG